MPVSVLLAFALYYYRVYRNYLQRFVAIKLPDLGSPTTSQHHSRHSNGQRRQVYGQMPPEEGGGHDEENGFETVSNPMMSRVTTATADHSSPMDTPRSRNDSRTRHHNSLGSEDHDEGEVEEVVDAIGILKSGFLQKKSTRGSWRRRWFFIKDGRLFYTHDDDLSPKKSIINAVPVANFTISTIKVIDSLQFQVISPGKRGVGTGGGTYTLQADSEHECNEWIRVIQEQIAGSLSLTLQMTSHKQQQTMTATDLFVPGKATLAKLYSSNPYCVDCGAAKPAWASLNLGVMMCIECSGVHRSLGSHISKVRSLTLDKWSKNLVQLLLFIGNEHSNEIWEESLRRESGSEKTPKRLTHGLRYNQEEEEDELVVDSHGHQHRHQRDRTPLLTKAASARTGSGKGNEERSNEVTSKQQQQQRSMRPAGLSRQKFIQKKYAERAYVLKMAQEHNTDLLALRYLRAAAQGNLIEVQRCIALGVDINVRISTHLIQVAQRDGSASTMTSWPLQHTALMLAAKHGHVLCVELLVLWNVDLTLQDEQGCNAVELARQESAAVAAAGGGDVGVGIAQERVNLSALQEVIAVLSR